MNGHLDRLGVVTRADTSRAELQRLLRRGAIERVYPGVFVAAGQASSPGVRLTAVARARPGAVLIGAAARWAWWPELGELPAELEVANRCETRLAGVRTRQLAWPADHVVDRGPLRLSSRASTAAWLAGWDEGATIDNALRKGVRLADIALAASALRWAPGNVERRAVVAASRDEPWSPLERRCHTLLRAHQITGWRANLPIRLGPRDVTFVDVGFRRSKLAVQLDGFDIHTRREVFERDRDVHNALVALGWRVLRFTWRSLEHNPEAVVAAIRVQNCM